MMTIVKRTCDFLGRLLKSKTAPVILVAGLILVSGVSGGLRVGIRAGAEL